MLIRHGWDAHAGVITHFMAAGRWGHKGTKRMHRPVGRDKTSPGLSEGEEMWRSASIFHLAVLRGCNAGILRRHGWDTSAGLITAAGRWGIRDEADASTSGVYLLGY